MVATVLDAVSAYRKTSALPQELNAIGGAQKTSGGQSFGDVLQDVVGEGVEQLRAAESTSKLGVVGKAGPVEIATAVGAAETTLQLVIALRDKMISAYQEVARMSV
jgi:flagellar hook-basal body complex protein FliE